MYCTNCGVPGIGNFCAACGTRRAPPADEFPIVHPVTDWETEVRYDRLIQCSEVRERLAAIPECPKSVSAEDWLGLYDKVFQSANHGISLKTVAAIVGPLYAKIGIKTGKAHAELLDQPPGRIMTGVLCTLARRGWSLVTVHQGVAGCVFEAKLPSDLWSSEGRLIVTVEQQGRGTHVSAATNIPGQFFDWGKSTRCLSALFGELKVAA